DRRTPTNARAASSARRLPWSGRPMGTSTPTVATSPTPSRTLAKSGKSAPRSNRPFTRTTAIHAPRAASTPTTRTLRRAIDLALPRLAPIAEPCPERLHILSPEFRLDRLGQRAEAWPRLAQELGAGRSKPDEVRAPVVGICDALRVSALLEPAQTKEHRGEWQLRPRGQTCRCQWTFRSDKDVERIILPRAPPFPHRS